MTSADIISTVEFDHTGDYLATGDKGGRVVLFERNESVGMLAMNASARVEQLLISTRLDSLPTEEGLRIQIPHRVSES